MSTSALCHFSLYRKTLWMALTCSQMSLQSPFSHKDVYGVDHPTFGALCVRKTTSVKHKSKKSKKSTSSGKKSATSSTSIKVRGHTKKKNSAGGSAKSNRTHEPTVHHHSSSVKPRGVTSPAAVLARVDSPVQHSTVPHFSSSRRTSVSRTPSETTAGYSSSKPRSTTSSSVTSRATTPLPTSDILLSLNKSQDSLKSDILSSSINVGLKRASIRSVQAAGCLPFSRAFSDSPSRPGLKTSRGRKGDPLTPENLAWGLGRLHYRNIIVMSGAGISTSSGIPDFR